MDNKLLYADGLDDAIVGVGYRCGKDAVVCYDSDKVIEILQGQGMSYEEAQDWAEFNVFGSWVGEKTPMWVTLFTKEENSDENHARELEGP